MQALRESFRGDRWSVCISFEVVEKPLVFLRGQAAPYSGVSYTG